LTINDGDTEFLLQGRNEFVNILGSIAGLTSLTGNENMLLQAKIHTRADADTHTELLRYQKVDYVVTWSNKEMWDALIAKPLDTVFTSDSRNTKTYILKKRKYLIIFRDIWNHMT
jgi:hypothetical protein